MVRREVERLAEKTAERQFLYEMETDFELAPAASRAVLETAQQVFLPSSMVGEVREGQMRVTVVSDHEPSGKPLSAMKKVSVVVTVDSGMEDLEVLRRFGWEGLRRCRLLADDGGGGGPGRRVDTGGPGPASANECADVRRDIVSLRAEGHWVPTRGVVQEIGRGQSHKAKIVEMYLQRMTYSEIVRRAHHAPGSVKRYVETFGRVVVLWEKGVRDLGESPTW